MTAHIIDPTESTMDLETITPQIATEMLGRNIRNRNMQRSTVNGYIAQISHGSWKVNGEAIKFDSNGNMIDGQHRLAAIIETGISMRTWVGRNFELDVQMTLDQQRKRSAGDVLAMYGIPQGNRVAAIVRMVGAWDRGERSIHGFAGSQHTIVAGDVLKLVLANKIYSEASSVVGHRTMQEMVNTRTAGTLYILTERIDASISEEFFRQINSGVGLQEGDPALTLRRYWTRLRASRDTASVGVQLNAGVRAWNNFILGRKLDKIAYKTSQIPEPVESKTKKASA